MRLSLPPGDRWPSFQIELAPYDPAWATAFEEESARIADAIPVLSVEHFGSTAVPGMLAKPVIDIVATVKHVDQVARDRLAALGYVYERDTGDPQHLFMGKGAPHRSHHLHLLGVGHPFRQSVLQLRDYLRTHPEEAAAYADVKRRAAGVTRDAFLFFQAKYDDVSALTARAAAWDAAGRPER
jgi:GrpB-like predicted nucleotidyltransferase (UPF0157 family)